eukprot:CAMPEP_0116918648 /NCGR_PEP_ID=MMETSP0467-20121206/19891_1 /TAXON_ID=283647 /ORGANISM="Mesodinium pulex, Strain SPMC105" /LENGTH=46 /DNA_ID= /DNA_START= /DNA_END= /DNA_ORIENTATION=
MYYRTAYEYSKKYLDSNCSEDSQLKLTLCNKDFCNDVEFNDYDFNN